MLKTHTVSFLCYTGVVAVESDETRPFTHASALGFYSRVSTGGSSKRFFYAHLFYASVRARQLMACMGCTQETHSGLYGQTSGRVSYGLHRLYPRKTVPRFTPCVRPACLLGTG